MTLADLGHTLVTSPAPGGSSCGKGHAPLPQALGSNAGRLLPGVQVWPAGRLGAQGWSPPASSGPRLATLSLWAGPWASPRLSVPQFPTGIGKVLCLPRRVMRITQVDTRVMFGTASTQLSACSSHCHGFSVAAVVITLRAGAAVDHAASSWVLLADAELSI